MNQKGVLRMFNKFISNVRDFNAKTQESLNTKFNKTDEQLRKKIVIADGKKNVMKLLHSHKTAITKLQKQIRNKAIVDKQLTSTDKLMEFDDDNHLSKIHFPIYMKNKHKNVLSYIGNQLIANSFDIFEKMFAICSRYDGNQFNVVLSPDNPIKATLRSNNRYSSIVTFTAVITFYNNLKLLNHGEITINLKINQHGNITVTPAAIKLTTSEDALNLNNWLKRNKIIKRSPSILILTKNFEQSLLYPTNYRKMRKQLQYYTAAEIALGYATIANNWTNQLDEKRTEYANKKSASPLRVFFLGFKLRQEIKKIKETIAAYDADLNRIFSSKKRLLGINFYKRLRNELIEMANKKQSSAKDILLSLIKCDVMGRYTLKLLNDTKLMSRFIPSEESKDEDVEKFAPKDIAKIRDDIKTNLKNAAKRKGWAAIQRLDNTLLRLLRNKLLSGGVNYSTVLEQSNTIEKDSPPVATTPVSFPNEYPDISDWGTGLATALNQTIRQRRDTSEKLTEEDDDDDLAKTDKSLTEDHQKLLPSSAHNKSSFFYYGIPNKKFLLVTLKTFFRQPINNELSKPPTLEA